MEDRNSGHFQARTIDGVPALLEKSYALRYQVYCLERQFLPAENYPQGLEIDEFDRCAVHVGAIDARGELAGTARMVTISELGLPLFRHCTTFPNEMQRHPAISRLVEVGRLSVSRTYRRRSNDGDSGAHTNVAGTHARTPRRRGGADVFLTVLKALYQATKRAEGTHWVAAMEPSLERMLAHSGFPFRVLGPESDYFGLVTPYHMDLSEFDHVIVSGRFPLLHSFAAGLEPRFSPQSLKSPRPTRCTRPTTTRRLGCNREDIRTPVFALETEARLLQTFRLAAADVPAYRVLLDEHGVNVDDVTDFGSFSRSCPLLSKHNTFNRFPIDQLSVGGGLVDLADVLTSSGHGGQFSFGLTSRLQALTSATFIDQLFDDAFDVTSRKTLTINCLPMGVIFASHQMTVATTSVREDMAIALVEAFGHHYDQIVLVGDPLFLKRLTDHAGERGIEWNRYRVNVIIGEETFGEHFRGHLATCLGLDINQPDRGYIMSSFGVGELGLHLCYETLATIGLRRIAFDHPSFGHALLGVARNEEMPLPMIFSFDPLRTFIEIIDPDRHGYGLMTISMIDPERTVPLLRYQTGDIARLLDLAVVTDVSLRHGVTLPADLPETLLALRGRATESLPNGSHVAVYKDALYADRRIACHLTGAFRVIFSGARCTMHVQVAATHTPPFAAIAEGILSGIPARVRPEKVVVWAYSEFPFGMRLDYERKFSYHGMAAQETPATSVEPSCEEHAL